MALPRFFYLVPKGARPRLDGEGRLQYILRLARAGRRQPPMGGVKVIYQHCDILNRHGIEAFPVHVGGTFIVDWFPHESKPVGEREALAMLRASDVVVCPEVVPQFADPFPAERKVAFVQGWSLVEMGTGGRAYEDLGFTHLLACSDYNRDYMRARSALPCATVRNAIDLEVFRPPDAPRSPGAVLYMSRKHVTDARAAIELLPDEVRDVAAFTEHVGPSSQAEMAEYYQQADIFLASGYPEGFGLPPLEAMACGCAVVGFTGGGGNEFMKHEQTALVVPDGDVEGLSAAMARVLRDTELKDQIRQAGTLKANEYSLERTTHELLEFAASLGASSP